jgi:hypothetical protein
LQLWFVILAAPPEYSYVLKHIGEMHVPGCVWVLPTHLSLIAAVKGGMHACVELHPSIHVHCDGSGILPPAGTRFILVNDCEGVPLKYFSSRWDSDEDGQSAVSYLHHGGMAVRPSDGHEDPLSTFAWDFISSLVSDLLYIATSSMRPLKYK